MEQILILDTSVASLNKGDDIIMECVRAELEFITLNNFVLTLPTHVPPFHWYQVLRNSYAVQNYSNCRYKFVGGSNLLVKDMLSHYPQWNINIFNCAPLKGTVLMGVGASSHSHTNRYTRHLLRKFLNHNVMHSVRDERTRLFMEEELGLPAINTGCPTMWMLTPRFCRTIPTAKAPAAVFTLTPADGTDKRDRELVDILRRNYSTLYFWPQGIWDMNYLTTLGPTCGINVLPPTKDAYHRLLEKTPCIDYVGTRLHAGIYAMRHRRRSIIIAIDERAREINSANNLNCIEKDSIETVLEPMINSEFATDIHMPFDKIEQWKMQFR